MTLANIPNRGLSCERVSYEVGEITRSSHPVKIQCTSEEDHLYIEMEDQSRASEVDQVEGLPDLETATESELDQLGLLLLNRVATDVTHIRISGYNYISFKIY